jgi:ATP-dependent DNA helicase RecQ
MADYASGVTCRHRAIVRYFGQELERDNCNACDVCLGDLELADDAQVLAQKILSCVYRLKQGFGADYTAGVLAGSREQRVLDAGHDKLSTHGLLADQSKKQVRDWIEQLVGQGYLLKRGEYSLLRITEKGWHAIRGEDTPRLLRPVKRAAKRAVTERFEDSWEGVDFGLFEALRDLRRAIARRKHVPAYIVFGDASLRDMARKRPTTVEAFRQVNGVGDAKARQYAREFTTAIKNYLR